MSEIKTSYVTNAGKQLLFGGGTVTYTKAALYSQDVSSMDVDDLHKLTALTGELKSTAVGVSDKKNGQTSSVNVEATFTNENLDHDIVFHSVGWFAKQNDQETLMAVQIADDAILAACPPGGKATEAIDLTLAFAIGDATTVTAVIDPAASVTPAILKGAISDLRSEVQTALDPLAKSEDVQKALSLKADQADVTAKLATKADKTTVESDLATKAEVAKKADSEDVTKQLATKANVSDVDDALSKKDDTADVDQKIATVNKSVSDLSDTVSANKTATDASLATKANASDVADNVKTLQANIDTKADKATVDAEIAKIDFTPYAKSADVANELQNYTTTVDLNKLLAGKEDAGTSYSKAELDKKLLALSTDTSGKVNADQVSSMIANKVDKSDLASDLKAVNDSIATKANSSDVDLALAKKMMLLMLMPRLKQLPI